VRIFDRHKSVWHSLCGYVNLFTDSNSKRTARMTLFVCLQYHERCLTKHRQGLKQARKFKIMRTKAATISRHVRAGHCNYNSQHVKRDFDTEINFGNRLIASSQHTYSCLCLSNDGNFVFLRISYRASLI
jgi:hypothetical protein